MPTDLWGLAPATQFWWAVPTVGLIGALVALYSILANRHIARMRATLDLIERTESSPHYLDIRRSFKRLQTEPAAMARIKTPGDEADRTLRRDVLAYLNHYELVAIGCRTGILDPAFYARWMRTTLVRDMQIAAPLIEALRTDPASPIPAAFEAAEALARRFAD